MHRRTVAVTHRLLCTLGRYQGPDMLPGKRCGSDIISVLAACLTRAQNSLNCCYKNNRKRRCWKSLFSTDSVEQWKTIRSDKPTQKYHPNLQLRSAQSFVASFSSLFIRPDRNFTVLVLIASFSPAAGGCFYCFYCFQLKNTADSLHMHQPADRDTVGAFND